MEASLKHHEEDKEPQKYFLVTNVEAGISGRGYINEEAIELLVGEHFPIAGFRTDEGKPAWVVVRAHDIAMNLGADGTDPAHWPAVWWQGYADAFKGPGGELAADAGFVSMPLSNGEVFEASTDADMFDFLSSRANDRY